MKKINIPISKFFETINPTYAILQIIPDKSIRNYDSASIAKSLVYMRKKFIRRVRKDKWKILYEKPVKISFIIDINKNNASFYFIVPKLYVKIIIEQCYNVWNKSTIKEIKTIDPFSNKAVQYQLNYSKEDALSFKVDKKINQPLSNILGVMEIMEDTDRCAVIYNFNPCPQQPWIEEYDETIKKYKDHKIIDKKQMSKGYVFKNFIIGFIKLIDVGLFAVNKALSVNNTTNKPLFDEVAISGLQRALLGEEKKISLNTIKKRELNVIKTQMLIISESTDKTRKTTNALSICDAYKLLDEDNKIVYQKIENNKKIDFFDYRYENVLTNKLSTEECKMLFEIPGRDILSHYQSIKKIDVLENPVPKELQKGYISLGLCKFKGESTEAFLRDTYDQGNLPLVPIGEQGSGKTTFLSNYAKCVNKRKEALILIDFIKNCELSNTIEKILPKEDVISINLGDMNQLQGFGYNELTLPEDASIEDKLEIANTKALYTSMLLDAINVDGEPLSTQMDRYLSASSNVVYLNQNASIRDVLRCLEDADIRMNYINSIPTELCGILEDEIRALKELNDTDKQGNLITKISKIDGIYHRINLLKKDIKLKLMFNKGTENNLDLVKAMEDGKIVLFKMPQIKFQTPYSKNVITTYLLTKIWASLQIRGSMNDKPKRCHILIDEVFQAPTAMMLLKDQEILPQTRKFGGKFVFSCQSLKQIDMIDQTLRDAGASYMLLKGSGKNNFNEFKEQLVPFTLEDIEALPQYYSMNLINYEKGRAKFITKLPPKPI